MWNEEDHFDELTRRLEDVARRTDYPIDAFAFVLHVVSSYEAPILEADHIDARELCWRLHDAAIDAFGKHARERLDSWSIRTCSDFGSIVYALVDAGLMQKTDQDSIEDFQNVFDFDDAFQSYARATEFRDSVQWGLSTMFILMTLAAIAFAGFAKHGMGGAIGTVTASFVGAIGLGCLLHAVRRRARGWVEAVCVSVALLAVAIAMLLDFLLR